MARDGRPLRGGEGSCGVAYEDEGARRGTGALRSVGARDRAQDGQPSYREVDRGVRVAGRGAVRAVAEQVRDAEGTGAVGEEGRVPTVRQVVGGAGVDVGAAVRGEELGQFSGQLGPGAVLGDQQPGQRLGLRLGLRARRGRRDLRGELLLGGGGRRGSAGQQGRELVAQRRQGHARPRDVLVPVVTQEGGPAVAGQQEGVGPQVDVLGVPEALQRAEDAHQGFR